MLSFKKAFLRISEREYSRRDLFILFVIAVVVGASFKAWVNDTITIGFDDYKLKESTQSLDLNKIQKELIANGGSLALVEKNVPQGKTCSE